MDDDEPKMEKPGRSIAGQFAELREICRQENYRLPRVLRTPARENAFVKILDELAGMTEKEIDAIVVSQADDPTEWEEEAHVRPRNISSVLRRLRNGERAGRKR